VRRIPEDRFDHLVDAATEVFIQHGYRLTQMADVARAVGVAKGSLYGYVASKEALFALCLRYADHGPNVPRPAQLPIETPKPGQLASDVKQRLADESLPPRLVAALERDRAGDPRAELEEIVREFYALLERNRRAIKLIDRCMDHPEIGAIWHAGGREGTRAALARYIGLRVTAGQFRQPRSVRLAARAVIEVVTTWAVHIHWDRAPERFDPDEARENAIEFAVRGLLP